MKEITKHEQIDLEQKIQIECTLEELMTLFCAYESVTDAKILDLIEEKFNIRLKNLQNECLYANMKDIIDNHF